MTRFLPFLLLCSLLPLSGCWPGNGRGSSKGYPKLELVAAYTLDMPGPLEPSGLTMWDGTLYTVADKDNRTIYRVQIDGPDARLVPAIKFKPPQPVPMDWEGISVDSAGSFYLISEDWGQILRVTQSGQASWETPDLRPEPESIGLFAKNNAGFEGIAWLGPNHWLGAVEREPRGLVEIRRTDETFQTNSSLYEHSPFSDALPLLRIPDFSGLDTDQGNIYALFRNAHLVVRLEQVDGILQEAEAWSYRHLEIDPRWAYRAQVYGQAEGIVVNGQDVYLIFDNNLGPRLSDPNDGRPLLIHARFPKAS